MTKTKKNEVVSALTEEFKNSSSVVVCSYKGLSHSNLETLRQNASASETKVKVVKNTLASIAIKEAGYSEVSFSEPNIFIWSEDSISACKVAYDFAKSKDNAKESFEIKSGIIDGETASIETINQFAKLPGKDELIGMLLSVWTAPARNFVTGLDNLKQKLEEEA